jgi:hypothetical protein
MRPVDDLHRQAKSLPPQAPRELRDRLTETLEDEKPPAEQTIEGPYASLKSAGSAHAISAQVARNKNKHLAEVYAPKRTDR